MNALEKLKKLQQEAIDKHMPAKGAPVLTEEEKSDIDKFKELYEQAHFATQDTSRHIENDGFHPSWLGTYSGKCQRRACYLLRGVRKTPNFTARVLRIFANGHAVHERIQTMLDKMGILIEAEVPVRYDYPPITGHADGIIELEWNGRRILIEIKSINETGFTNRLKFKKPKAEHTEQANIYAHILGIDIIWVIYESKNDQDMCIFEIKVDHAAAEKQIKKWSKTYDIFKEGKLPKRPYGPDSQACMSCDLRDHCLSDPDVGV